MKKFLLVLFCAIAVPASLFATPLIKLSAGKNFYTTSQVKFDIDTSTLPFQPVVAEFWGDYYNSSTYFNFDVVQGEIFINGSQQPYFYYQYDEGVGQKTPYICYYRVWPLFPLAREGNVVCYVYDQDNDSLPTESYINIAEYSTGEPDLTGRNTSFSPVHKTVRAGENFTFNVDIANVGNLQSAVQTKINFYWNQGSRIYSPTFSWGDAVIPVIEANDSVSRSYEFNIPVDMTPGDYFFYYYIDSRGELSESDEGNNKFYTTITVVEPLSGCTDPNASNYDPDARVDDGTCIDEAINLYVDSSEIYRSDTAVLDPWTDYQEYEALNWVHLTIPVRNSGTSPSGSFFVTFYFNPAGASSTARYSENRIMDTSVVSIDPNEGRYVEIDYQIPLLYAGDYTMSWRIDAVNSVYETNENDNKGYALVRILAGDGQGTGEVVSGCTDSNACNYNSEATVNDDSCDYSCNFPSGEWVMVQPHSSDVFDSNGVVVKTSSNVMNWLVRSNYNYLDHILGGDPSYIVRLHYQVIKESDNSFLVDYTSSTWGLYADWCGPAGESGYLGTSSGSVHCFGYTPFPSISSLPYEVGERYIFRIGLSNGYVWGERLFRFESSIVHGCTATLATNYNEDANVDDGSCRYIFPGCTDPNADNYNPEATIEDPDNPCSYGLPTDAGGGFTIENSSSLYINSVVPINFWFSADDLGWEVSEVRFYHDYKDTTYRGLYMTKDIHQEDQSNLSLYGLFKSAGQYRPRMCLLGKDTSKSTCFFMNGETNLGLAEWVTVINPEGKKGCMVKGADNYDPFAVVPDPENPCDFGTSTSEFEDRKFWTTYSGDTVTVDFSRERIDGKWVANTGFPDLGARPTVDYNTSLCFAGINGTFEGETEVCENFDFEYSSLDGKFTIFLDASYVNGYSFSCSNEDFFRRMFIHHLQNETDRININFYGSWGDGIVKVPETYCTINGSIPRFDGGSWGSGNIARTGIYALVEDLNLDLPEDTSPLIRGVVSGFTVFDFNFLGFEYEGVKVPGAMDLVKAVLWLSAFVFKLFEMVPIVGDLSSIIAPIEGALLSPPSDFFGVDFTLDQYQYFVEYGFWGEELTELIDNMLILSLFVWFIRFIFRKFFKN